MNRIGTWLVVGCIALASACGGSSAPDKKTGLGPSTERPTGTAYTLPAGVSVSGTIIGAADGSTCIPTQQLGSGAGFVNACLTLRNSTSGTITVTLPTGLIFVTRDTGIQNGYVVGPVVLVLKPGATAINIGLYCLNLGRHGSSAADVLDFGPVTDSPGLKEISSILAGKNLAGHEYDIQFAIWEYTDGSGLSDATRAKLRAY